MSNDEAKNKSGETVRIIEGQWNCTSCGAQGILGRFKECPSCSSPREEGKETEFTFGEKAADGSIQASTVSDSGALSQAARGEDWFCRFCNSANPGDGLLCGKCGAEKSKAALTPDQARVRGLLSESKAPVPQKRKIPGFVKVLGALLVVGILWNALRTEEIEAKVALAQWSHQVTRESFQPKTSAGWQDEIRLSPPKMPTDGKGEYAGAFDLKNCQRKFRRMEQFACGQERVCRPAQESYSCGSERKCTVKNLKNGFAQEVCHEVPKTCHRSVERCSMETRYCPREVFGSWCDYQKYEWIQAGKEDAQGQGAEVRWPGLSAGPLDRIQKSARYEIRLRENREKEAREWILKPEKEDEFLRYARARSVRVQLSGLGILKAAVPQ